MQGEDVELELFRHGVNCAALLERLPPPWRLDRQESTRRALKYRRGAGEIIIVNHDGRGWWDPRSAAKGDIFDLVQYLDPGLNFGQVRQVLRRFVGIAPQLPGNLPPATPQPVRASAGRALGGTAAPAARLTGLVLPVGRAWPTPGRARGGGASRYIVREGPYGSAWFAHRAEAGAVTHVEIRGPGFKGSLAGGTKTLFRLGHEAADRLGRVALTEAPIDALSLAALEAMRTDTLYAASGGGMGPDTVAAIEQVLRSIARFPGALIASATDADVAGERYAAQHAALAEAASIRFARLTPSVGTDWNDALRPGQAAMSRRSGGGSCCLTGRLCRYAPKKPYHE